ncbi:MAG: site-specific integrase [Myxococcales bacterium]|nr:site-specific integrase [Myxococcales bacterium]
MSVKATTRRGKPVWAIQVIRDGGAYNRRRFLDRRTYLKQDALAAEEELIAEYERTSNPHQGGERHQEEDRSGDAGAMTATTNATTTSSPRAAKAKASAPRETPTLADFAERYLALQDPRRSDFENKARYLRLHLLPHLGDLRLDQISSMVIDELRARLRAPHGERASSRRSLGRKDAPTTDRRKGGPKSPKTINNVLTTLRSMLNLALDYELIDRVPRFRMEKVHRPDPSFLEEAEVKRLIAATPAEWRLVVFTAVRTGLRRGELMGLRWEDVHLEGRRPTLRVRRSVKREPGGVLRVKEPKGGKPRSVPLTADLAEALRQARPERPEAGSLVFPGPCQGFLDHQRLWKVVSSAARAAGLDKHVHPHLLRHTFASECYRRGIPPQVVQLWLGHAHITTTERYAHLAPTAGEDLIDRLGGQVRLSGEGRSDLQRRSASGSEARAVEGCAIRGNTRGNTTDPRDAKNAV